MKQGACIECGSTTWLVSVVNDRGERTCNDCLEGWTALRKYGVPINKPVEVGHEVSSKVRVRRRSHHAG